MIVTARAPVSPGEILTEEFLVPLGLTQAGLAELMGVSRRLINEICQGRRAVTVDTALMLARVFDTTPEFWLNAQRRLDLHEATHEPERRARIERARPASRAGVAAE